MIMPSTRDGPLTPWQYEDALNLLRRGAINEEVLRIPLSNSSSAGRIIALTFLSPPDFDDFSSYLRSVRDPRRTLGAFL